MQSHRIFCCRSHSASQPFPSDGPTERACSDRSGAHCRPKRHTFPRCRRLAIAQRTPLPHPRFPLGLEPRELDRLRAGFPVPVTHGGESVHRSLVSPVAGIRPRDALPRHLPRGRLQRLAGASSTACCGVIRWIEALLVVAHRSVTLQLSRLSDWSSCLLPSDHLEGVEHLRPRGRRFRGQTTVYSSAMGGRRRWSRWQVDAGTKANLGYQRCC